MGEDSLAGIHVIDHAAWWYLDKSVEGRLSLKTMYSLLFGHNNQERQSFGLCERLIR